VPATSVRSSGVAKEPSASRMQWRGKETTFLSTTYRSEMGL
jgi:hypothetical protein